MPKPLSSNPSTHPSYFRSQQASTPHHQIVHKQHMCLMYTKTFVYFLLNKTILWWTYIVFVFFCTSTTHDVVFWLKTHFISCHPKCISNGFQMGCTDTNMSVLIRWLWWGNEMIIWWYDEMMTWCCCDFMIWWHDDMIIWRYGDIRNVMNVMQINDIMI